MNNIIFERFKNYWFIYPFILLWIIKPFLPEWGVVPPKSCLGGCGTIEGMIPFVQWVNNLIDILRNYEIFGFFTFREFTRSIANLIDIPLDFTEALLYKGFNTIPLGPMPWVMILGLVIILGATDEILSLLFTFKVLSLSFFVVFIIDPTDKSFALGISLVNSAT